MRRTIRPVVEVLEEKALLTASGLALSLTATPTVTPTGPKVVLTFTETNVTNHDIMTSYGPSGDGFVATQDGKAIWASNAGVNPFYLVLDDLKPGQSIKLTATWDGHSDLGTPGFLGTEGPVQSGTFVIHNQLAPDGPTATVTLATSSTSAPKVLLPTHITPPKPPALGK